jgi:putative FmdB family regulatory protein
MPIYEYKCNSCGKTFEKMEKFSDPPLTIHEECGGPVERLISAPALQFKGTGWYITDYAKSNGSSPGKNGAESKKDSASGAKSESGSSSAAESKPSTPAPSASSSDKK